MSSRLHLVRPLFRHPGRTLLLGLAFLVLATRLSAQAAGQAQSRAALKASIRAAGFRVLIGMRPDSLSHGMLAPGQSALSDNAAEAIARNLERKGLRRLGRVSLVPVVYGQVEEADLDGILDDPNVEYVEPDDVMPLAVHASGPSVRLAESMPWGIPQVTAPSAWSLGGSAAYGAGVKVAYLDSGADWTHPDLLYAGGYNAMLASTAASDWFDDIGACGGHGTHVAGTIAARHNTDGVVGVAPEASLYGIKVFQDVGGVCGSYQSSQINGMDWAVKNGIRVISISIGGTTFNSSYQSAITSAVSKGVYIVAAAGNNGSATMTYPGNYQDVISVAALDPNNNRSSYSNYGPNLYISAPGDGIYSTLPGGYGYKSGTSMATPHVAGVVTLLLARYPGITRAQLLARLQQGALDLGAAGRDDNFGWGLARAREAMDAAVTQPLALGVTPASRRDTVASGASSADPDSAGVALSGDNSATTAWSAAAAHPWTQLSSATGTGSGMLRWTRNPTGLAAGVWVDTVTVSAGGLSARVIDSLVVSPPPQPLSLAVAPASRRDSVELGTAAHADSGSVSLSGTGAATASWSATRKSAWLTLTTASGTGSGKVRWSRNSAGLAAGIYVDTISVSAAGAAGSPARIIDSLRIYLNPLPLTASVSPASRYRSAKAGSLVPPDSASVTLSGAGATLAAWSATNGKPWVTLTTAAGVGSGRVRWSHNLTGLSAGTYVDTINVVVPGALGSPGLVIDSLVVTALKGKRSNKTTGAGASVDAGASLQLDSVYVDVAAGVAWQAATTASWVALVNDGGTGPGHLRWQRRLAGMGYGISQDSIVVSSGSGETREVELVVTETVVAGADQVPATLAAAGLFGSSPMTALQQRMLDLLGNANGRYDVGDFLAYLDRTGAALSAPLMARVMALPQPH